MSYRDLSHILDVGMQGSAGPSVGYWEMGSQAIQQQWHVNSQLAYDEELRERWTRSLEALRTAGQNFNAPVDPQLYTGYADFVRHGTPITTPTIEGSGYAARINENARQPHPEFEEMRRANEAIRQLNNPEVKTFEQILEEVSEMQRGVEEETASMRERAPFGSFFAELAGGAIGSFSVRDPLNIITAPIGAGRTIAMRIATDMAIAAGVTTATEYGSVQQNRELAGLPERDPLFEVAAATLGAGIIRGGIEGIGRGLEVRAANRAAQREAIDLRDTQLQQMFGALDDSPRARAASSILDDTIVFEHSNPYGEGQVAGYRWQAELEGTARALNGEEDVHIELPPVPSEYIERQLSFQSVKETAPEIWNELETARARLADVEEQTARVGRSAEEAFTELADLQRGAPEMAMLRAQKVLGDYRSGNALGMALEHVGDITHRMSQHGGAWNNFGLEFVAPKVRTGLSVVTNVVDSARIAEIPDLPELARYAEEHAQLPVYNKAQAAARDAAIALGKRDLAEARRQLEYLQGLIDSGEYSKIAGTFNDNSGVVRAYHGTAQEFGDYSIGKALFEKAIWFTSDTDIASAYAKVASPGGYSGSHVRFDDIDITNFAVHEIGGKKYNAVFVKEAVEQAKAEGKSGIIFRQMDDGIGGVNKPADVIAVLDTKAIKPPFKQAKLRQKANAEYRAAYAKVEAEAERLEHAEAAKRSVAQAQSIDVLGPDIISQPMTGPMTRQDFVEAHTARVEEADAAIPARSDAVNDLQIDPETNMVDIGTKTPVSADFKVPFEDGELTVKQILDDLAEDKRLEEAVKGCAI